MLKRPLWFMTGVAAGVGGTLWVEHRIREAMARLEPDNVAREAVDSVRQLGGRVREAVEAGRAASDLRERELRREMRLGPRLSLATPTKPAGRPGRPARHLPGTRGARR